MIWFFFERLIEPRDIVHMGSYTDRTRREEERTRRGLLGRKRKEDRSGKTTGARHEVLERLHKVIRLRERFVYMAAGP